MQMQGSHVGHVPLLQRHSAAPALRPAPLVAAGRQPARAEQMWGEGGGSSSMNCVILSHCLMSERHAVIRGQSGRVALCSM